MVVIAGHIAADPNDKQDGGIGSVHLFTIYRLRHPDIQALILDVYRLSDVGKVGIGPIGDLLVTLGCMCDGLLSSIMIYRKPQIDLFHGKHLSFSGDGGPNLDRDLLAIFSYFKRKRS
jgi:hypothetical protein